MNTDFSTRPTVQFGPGRIALGTAQLAGPYGIVGTLDRLSVESNDTRASELLKMASSFQLASVDTAPAYGRAETMIGSSVWRGPVWTKLDPKVPIAVSVQRSLTALRRTRIDVLFIHDMTHLRSLSRGERAELQRLLGSAVGALGISAYELEDVIEAHELIGATIVQAPVNVFDTRFETAVSEGQMPAAVRYVARSALLQGALATPTTAAERLRGPLAERLIGWSTACAALSVRPGEAALLWALSREFVDSVIVGAEGASQLREIVTWSEGRGASEILSAIQPENLWPLTDPRQW